MSVGSITKFGMVGWMVRDHTVNAVAVMPGVLATFVNGGARRFGDALSRRSTLCQPEQTLCAYAKPFAGSPMSTASATRASRLAFGDSALAADKLLM